MSIYKDKIRQYFIDTNQLTKGYNHICFYCGKEIGVEDEHYRRSNAGIPKIFYHEECFFNRTERYDRYTGKMVKLTPEQISILNRLNKNKMEE